METHKPKSRYLTLVLILGSLTALSPFSIDMYLSAFPMMAQEFHTSVAEVSMTLSSYFIGLASGQLFYGPLMDRFGRKKPLYGGLAIYIMASVGCALSKSVDTLIILRFVQAIGGCAAGVGAFAMVRDLFEPKESAKVFSSLILILGTSPLLAPTIGGYVAIYLGWQSVFYILAIASAILLIVVFTFLPESHDGDKNYALHPGTIAKTYLEILKEPQFYAYAVSGAMAFAGLFVYLAASPAIFMELFGISEQAYGWIFAFIAMGLVGMSQLNVVLIRKFTNEQILLASLSSLTLLSCIFLVSAATGFYNITSVVVMMFIFLSCLGLSNPNSAALAMAPFGSKAGSAASMMGFLQMGIGSLASVCVGIFKAQQLLPLAIIFVATSSLALMIMIVGSRQITKKIEVSEKDLEPVAH